MSITHVTTVSQLNTIISSSNDKLTVIDFHATWCGPCHAIAPIFEALAKQYPNVNFLKCDVDAGKEVATAYKVTAMPTFMFLKGNKQVHTIRGADRQGLQNAVKQHALPTGTFPGQGQTLGDSSSPAPPSGGNAWTNLDPQIKILLGLIAAYIFFWMM